MWKDYRLAIVTRLFIPFFLYFIMLIFTRTYTFEEKISGYNRFFWY